MAEKGTEATKPPIISGLTQDELWLELLLCGISSGSGEEEGIKKGELWAHHVIVSFHCLSGAEQKGVSKLQETWKKVEFGLRGRTSWQHSHHRDARFGKKGGPNEMNVVSLMRSYGSRMKQRDGRGKSGGKEGNAVESLKVPWDRHNPEATRLTAMPNLSLVNSWEVTEENGVCSPGKNAVCIRWYQEKQEIMAIITAISRCHDQMLLVGNTFFSSAAVLVL